MRDQSKAQWPDNMTVKERTAAPQWTSLYVYDEDEDSYQLDVLGDTRDIAEYRVRQICALPKMVELLKEIAEQTLWAENENGEYEGTQYHFEAQTILREIGEGE